MATIEHIDLRYALVSDRALEEDEKRTEISFSGFYRENNIFIDLYIDFAGRQSLEYCNLKDANKNWLDYRVVRSEIEKSRFELQPVDAERGPNLVFEFEIVDSDFSIVNLAYPNVSFSEAIVFRFDPKQQFGLEFDLNQPFDSNCFYNENTRKLQITLRFSATFESLPTPQFSNGDKDLLRSPFQDILQDALFCCTQHDSNKNCHTVESDGGLFDSLQEGDSARIITEAEHVSLVINAEYCSEKLLLEHNDNISFIYLELLKRDLLTFSYDFILGQKDFIDIELQSNLLFKREYLDRSIPEHYKKIEDYSHSFDVDWYYYDDAFLSVMETQDFFLGDLFLGFDCFKVETTIKDHPDVLLLPAYRFDTDRAELSHLKREDYDCDGDCKCLDPQKA